MSTREGQPGIRVKTGIASNAMIDQGIPAFPSSRKAETSIRSGWRGHPIKQASWWRHSFSQCVRTEWRFGHIFHFAPVMLGAGAVTWFVLETPPSTLAIVLLLCGAIIALGFASAHLQLLRVLLWSVFLFAAGMAAAVFETRRTATIILDQALVTYLTGTVERREAGSGTEWRYIIRLTDTAEPTIRRPPERVSLLARGAHDPVPIGGVIAGRARLSPPSGSAVPGLNDFAFASFYNGVGAVGFFLGAPKGMGAYGAETQAAGMLGRIDRVVFTLRDHISTRIRSIIPGDPGAFAAAIITGERRSMSKEATEALRLSGLAHITAISGLNMALAAGIFFVGFRSALSLFPAVAQAYPVKKLAAFGALVAITGYLMISGYQVSAVRAYLMTGMMLIAVLCDRPALSLRNLAVAGGVIILATPSAAMGPSFQMSFAATAALIAGYNFWQRRPESLGIRRSSMLRKITYAAGAFVGGVLLTSIIGGASTAIFSVYHFNRLALHGLEANLAAMPLISMIVMPAGFIGMLLMPFGLDRPFFVVMGLGLQLVLAVAREVASWGDGATFMRQPALFLPLCIIGFLLLTFLKTRLRWIGAMVMATTIATVWFAPAPRNPDLLVSEDGEIVGVWVGADTLATNRARPSAFIFDQWRTALGIARHNGPENLGKAPRPEAATRSGRRKTFSPKQMQELLSGVDTNLSELREDRFTCYAGLCAMKTQSGWTVATVQRPELIPIACDRADIVISPTRWRYLDCPNGTRLLTANHLKQTGSLEIRLGALESMTWTVRQTYLGDAKPWTEHRLYDWRDNRFAERHEPLDKVIKSSQSHTFLRRNTSDRRPAAERINDIGE